MRAIEVDPEARTARAGGGVLWGELDAATQAHGLATVGGIVTHTGIAGLTLGGGIGWLMRRHGATVDNLLAADVVTVDGDLLRASEDENPDLFWGLRGGGGNFGIVTSFEYRLHEVGPTILGGPLYFALEDAPRGAALLPRLHRRRARRPHHDPQPAHGAAAAVHPAGVPRPAGRDRRGLLGRRPRARRGGARAAAPLRDPARRRRHPAPVRRAAAAVRPERAARLALSLALMGAAAARPTPRSTRCVDQAARITSPRSYIIVFQLGGAVARARAATPPSASATPPTT